MKSLRQTEFRTTKHCASFNNARGCTPDTSKEQEIEKQHREWYDLAKHHPEHFGEYLEYHKLVKTRKKIRIVQPYQPLSEKHVKQWQEEMLARWAYAREFGHYQHALVEEFYRCKMSEDEALRLGEKFPRYFGAFLHYHMDMVRRGYRACQSEWRLLHKTLRLPGTIDMLYVDRQGKFILVDWKFSKNVDPTANWGRCFKHITPPMRDTTYWKYVLQLNAYRLVVHQNLDIRISEMYILVFHEVLNKTYEEFRVPVREKQIQQMFDVRAKQMQAVTQAQYEDAKKNGWTDVVDWTLKNGAVASEVSKS